jgi:hypothetical protein
MQTPGSSCKDDNFTMKIIMYTAYLPKIAGSNLTEAVGFFRAKKSTACLPSEGK